MIAVEEKVLKPKFNPPAAALLAEVRRLLTNRNIKAFLVGGFVRHLLLATDTADIDLADIDLAVTANALDINHPDNTFDYCFVHDLFEHLSLEAMEKAITEICRVTKKRLCLGFFNIHTGPKHRVLPIDNYHWNQLSLSTLTSTLKTHCQEIQIIPINNYLTENFACPHTHNKKAHTVMLLLELDISLI